MNDEKVIKVLYILLIYGSYSIDIWFNFDDKLFAYTDCLNAIVGTLCMDSKIQISIVGRKIHISQNDSLLGSFLKPLEI